MTYEEFKKELYRNILRQEKSGGKEIRLLERGKVCMDTEALNIVKFINLSCRGSEDTVLHDDIICVTKGEGGLFSMLYWQIRPLYERFKSEGWQSVLPELVAKESNAFGTNAYGIDSSRLILRPVNYHRNMTESEDCIYWRFGDVALVLYTLVFESSEDLLTMKVGRSMTAGWEISDELILTNALLNTYAKMPPRLYHAPDVHYPHQSGEGVFMPGEEGTPIEIHITDEQEGLRGYRLTTTKGVNGAVAYFYPGVRERLAELLGGDYYVGFTSIHEAVIHPVQHKILGEMKAAIQHTNAVFGEREMLSNCVYRYMCSRKGLVEV